MKLRLAPLLCLFVLGILAAFVLALAPTMANALTPLAPSDNASPSLLAITAAPLAMPSADFWNDPLMVDNFDLGNVLAAADNTAINPSSGRSMPVIAPLAAQPNTVMSITDSAAMAGAESNFEDHNAAPVQNFPNPFNGATYLVALNTDETNTAPTAIADLENSRRFDASPGIVFSAAWSSGTLISS